MRISALLLVSVFLFAFQCNDEAFLENTYLERCHAEKETVKTVRNKQGIVSNYSPRDTTWVILSVPGDDRELFYDSQDVGVLCKLPDSLKIHGLNVIFSGDLKTYDGELEPVFPGHTMYYLSITSLTERVDSQIP